MYAVFAAEMSWIDAMNVGVAFLVAVPLLLVLCAAVRELGRNA